MPFICSFCTLRPGVKGRRVGPGKCKLTDDNIAGVEMLLKQSHPDAANLVDPLQKCPSGLGVCGYRFRRRSSKARRVLKYQRNRPALSGCFRARS